MESLALYSVFFTASVFVYLLLWRKKKNTALSLPPGPPAWPVVGNLFQMGGKTNEIFFTLSKKYGPLMTLHLGMRTTVVVSSSAMAKEVLKTHDHIFAGRPFMASAKAHNQYKSAMASAEYGPHWRKIRRVATAELFSPKRLQALRYLRRDQVSRTLRLIFEKKGNTVHIGHMVFYTSLNLLGNMIFSKSVLDPHNPASVEFKDTVWRLMKLGSTPNLADFFPFLAFLDPQRILSRTAMLLQKMYDFFDVFIQDRLAARRELKLEQSDSDKDFLDVLLDYRSEEFTVRDIRIFVAELFMAGSDTTATTIEWAMAELIHSPEALKRVQTELEEVVGLNRRVEESDINKLPFFRAVVKEVFRMHPAVPLMLPHRAESACKVA
ncbi:hypothetical protein KI387_017524 [Taxus chinensis]|uniref:Cytochrome P450 n=1 Tax=Taxus chinensis TaxID=29808 RepID=A0AA38GIY4_TAXCH|nr:hypothetical protein KI387_017524 [Taxus chinensis]